MSLRQGSTYSIAQSFTGSLSITDGQVDLQKRALIFSGAFIACALLLQRFGITVGSGYLDSVAPAGLGLGFYGLLSGALAISRRGLLVFMCLCASVMSGTCVALLLANGYGAVSWSSLIQFLALSSFAVLTFAVPVDEHRFFRVVNFWLAFVAAAGLIEFFLQFAGIRLFSFDGIVPDTLLVERNWNVVIPIGDTLYSKANGFFLLEPSLFSQFTALALLIEILVLRRVPYLCLFCLALITSVSGTGWLMIIGFVLTAAFSLGSLGIIVAGATIAVGAVALGGLAFISPDIYNFLIDRTSEFNGAGSSAFLRFVTPWWFAADVLEKWPPALFFGLGAGLSEHSSNMPSFDYNINSPVKVFVEYGGPAVVAFVALFFSGSRTPTQNALIAPVLVWVMTDGGNSETAFVLFPALLVLVTARLSNAKVQK